MRWYLALALLGLAALLFAAILYATLSGYHMLLVGLRWPWLFASFWLILSSAVLLLAPFLKKWPSGPGTALIGRLAGVSCAFAGLGAATLGLAPDPMPQHLPALVGTLGVLSFLSLHAVMVAAIVVAVRQRPAAQ